MATTSGAVLLLVVAIATESFVLGAANGSVAELVRERWREKLPDVGIPQPLLKRLSPLSLTQLTHFTEALKNSGDTSFNASHFCWCAGLSCREQVQFDRGCSSHGLAKRTDEQIKEHLFFERKELRETGEIILPNMGLRRTRVPFLPSELAELMLPFSSANISGILRLLDIPTESNMSRNMASTLKMCEETAAEGEVKRCSTSIEAMVEFVVSLLGSDVDMFSDSSAVGSGQLSMVTMASKRENIVGDKSPVTCHNFVFPYAVIYCHSIRGSEVFDLQLEVMEDDKQLVRNATALCHYFSHGEGGNEASCHVVYGEMLLWTPKPRRDQ